MANAEDVAAVITLLERQYPRQPKVTDDSLLVWASLLADVPSEVLKGAVLAHIATSKWFPTVAELREQAVKISAPVITNGVTAWGVLRRALSDYAQGWVYCSDYRAVEDKIRSGGEVDYGDAAHALLAHRNNCDKCEKSKDFRLFLHDPIALRIAEGMGIRYLMGSEDEMADRAHFLKEYEKLSLRVAEGNVQHPAVKALAEKFGGSIGLPKDVPVPDRREDVSKAKKIGDGHSSGAGEE